jgi:hypothetical protein
MVKQSLAESISAQLTERTYQPTATIKVEGEGDRWRADVIRIGATTGKLRTWSSDGFTPKQAIARALQCATHWESTGQILLLPRLDRVGRNMARLAAYLDANPSTQPPTTQREVEALAGRIGVGYWDLRDVLKAAAQEARKHGQ